MAVCVEKKLTLASATHLFRCELLHWENGFGILKYVIDRPYRINDVDLHIGDVTYALYWPDRPYTLYIWHLSGDRHIYYFNIADMIVLSPAEFVWRDLVVDILVDAELKVHILDENELPPVLSPELGSYISSAKKIILAGNRRIIEEAERALRPFLKNFR